MPEGVDLEQLNEESLRAVDIENTGQGLRYIRDLSGQSVTDDDLAPLLPLLLKGLRASPDPDRALHSFARWFAAVGSPYSHLQTLLRHPLALDLFCLVTGSSQYFADLLARHPEYIEIITNPGVRGGTKTAATLYRELSVLTDICLRPELKRDVLRRWKAREMLRIGVRDLLGLSDMPATAREFSNLADACVQKALDIAFDSLPLQQVATKALMSEGHEAAGPVAMDFSPSRNIPLPNRASAPALPFVVIGMGKLGGQELNYSSDIDLIFVHGDDLPYEVTLADGRRLETTVYLGRLAETLIKTLVEDTANGHVFRVDMRLRPEGRFGPLTRSLGSCRAYYEAWAENWERQALLKARCIAGDRTLGEAFMSIAEVFAYPAHVSAKLLEDIRANKRRIEQQCALEGQTETNIKTGYGGIRDVEFIVQRLQLQFGGVRLHLRTPNTLAALQRLRHARLLTDAETHELAEDYQFLRNLEHRLQLLHSFQTQTLPTEERERLRVARRMGFVDVSAFDRELQRRRDRVHIYLETLFYSQARDEGQSVAVAPHGWAELNDLLDNLRSPAARERLAELLRAAGFRDTNAALRALQMPMSGNEFGGMPPDTPDEFKAIAPRLLDHLAHSPDPDAGLAGLEAIALAVPNRAQLYASFDDSPEFMEKLALLAAASPPLLKRLTQRLEWMETLFHEEEAEPESNLENENPSETTAGVGARSIAPARRGLSTPGKSFEANLESLARFYLRETLRIGAREVWKETDVLQTMTALTRLAETTLQALLDVCAEPLLIGVSDLEAVRGVLSRVAIVGLGKLGGEELGYGSDWDCVCTYAEAPGEHTEDAERLRNGLIEKLLAAVAAMKTYGVNLEIDLRLRPWGGKGAIIQSLRGFIEYYRTSAETWERQAALKARFVAGNAAVGHRCVRILQSVSFGRGITEEEDKAVQAMKRRIENERLKPAERETDLKLGYGGLTDVEWLVQKLQLQHGSRRMSIRHSNTLRALSALATARLIDNAEADTLAATYILLTRLRNGIWLQTGKSEDVFPADPLRRRALAWQQGYMDDLQETAETRLWEDVHAYMQETRRLFVQRFFA
jgi:[glutamine synthetase] adenylyltransferase / [glutamine synthetase]-adenylyl-L-tyrosine phosphorylase